MGNVTTMLRRRPSLGTVFGAVALFVALGGPADAARLINGAAIRKETITARAIKPGTLTGRLMRVASIGGERLTDRTVALSKLEPAAVTALQGTPQNEVTGAKVLDRSLSGADLGDETIGQPQIARDGVAGAEIADDAVGAGEVADGHLTVADIASFAGTATVDFPSLAAHTCSSPVEQAARPLWARQGVTLEDDAVFVSAPEGFDGRVVVTARPKGTSSLTFVACNLTGMVIDPPEVTLRYLTIEF